MKVKEIMTPDPQTCTTATSTAAAAHLMWQSDCGIIPVVDDGHLVGVVTDRDMYIALATRNERASRLPVGAVATRPAVTCVPEDDVQTALEIMKQARVRRLPVVGFGNVVLGLLSLDDLVMAAETGRGLRSEDVVNVLKAICRHHHPSAHIAAAKA